LGYRAHYGEPSVISRAYAAHSLFTGHRKFLYPNDRIAGSARGLYETPAPENLSAHADRIAGSYGGRHFGTNSDHFAPDYETVLSEGIGGMIGRAEKSAEAHRGDEKKLTFLRAMIITLEGLSEMIMGYAAAARESAERSAGAERENYIAVAETCEHVARHKPETFRQALQLVWLIHTSFVIEGRYAMALGRLDQYLYPFYARGTESGAMTRTDAVDLLRCAFMKTYESRDVVNIAIGGLGRDGKNAENELSLAVMDAVRACNIPGPNLSARLHGEISDKFLDEALKLIGTGIGYPALMNDGVNIKALERMGYSPEDCRDYAMVGCIENFITGKQPPWSDGRFNVPKYIELALNGGRCMLTGTPSGAETPEAEDIRSMEEFMEAFKKQAALGAAEYVTLFHNENDRYNAENYASPYLSCFCGDCIGRALDINSGGAVYPSAHGVACMGIATVADSLAAVEDVVFNKKLISLTELRDVLISDFESRPEVREMLLSAPKYGNNDDFADKYAVWYVEYTNKLFEGYRTRDGGRFYTAIAANVSNIYAGMEVAATPDGRRAKAALSDAGSAMRGMDKKGPTALINSLTKPDYTNVACGSVVNLKFTSEMFSDPGKREKLRHLVRAYMMKGGQELQMNSVSKEILIRARDNPAEYSDLVVRVSGFSAYYTQLDKRVQEDILERTEIS